MERLISVIVAVYNIKEYLPRCVDSILAQTCRNLEIILVDDGSTDGSGAICDEYAGRDARIKVIHQANGGLSSARNSGLEIAKGQYLGYVDGDDYIEPDMYKVMLATLIEQDAQIAVCRYRQLGVGAEAWQGTGKVLALSREEALEIFICGHWQYRIFPSVWSKLFLRERVKKLRFAVGKSTEDIMYTTEALCLADRCAYLDSPYYNYIVDRRGSIMNDNVGERRFNFEIPIWREQTAFLSGQGYQALAEKSKYYFYRRLLFYYIEFKRAAKKEYARRLSRMLQDERAEIRTVYRNPWVAGGDRVRMRLMLAWPELYYRTVAVYDKYLIPLRQSGSGLREQGIGRS